MKKRNGGTLAVVRTCVCACALCTLTAGAATISNIDTKTHYPWNGFVDVAYDVSGIMNESVYRVTANVVVGGEIYENAYVTNVSENTRYSFSWDAAAAGFRGRVEGAKVFLTLEEPNYAIIDLSGGPEAVEYPVTYKSVGAITNDIFKTSKLVLKRVVTAGGALTNYVGVYEVTQRQYELVTGENPSYYQLYSDPTVSNDVRQLTEWKRPVERVSYEAITRADGFFDRLTNRTHLALSLPTTNEWQAAARGRMPATKLYNLGEDGYRDLTDLAWLSPQPFRYGMTGMKVGNRNCSAVKGTAMAGSYEPNDLGLYDMHGNVSEWTRSTVVEVGLHQTTTYGVLCGGDYVSKIENCAVTSLRTVSRQNDVRFYYTGFRVFGDEMEAAFEKPVTIVSDPFTLDVATLPRQVRVQDDAGAYTFFYTPTNGAEIGWVALTDAVGTPDWKPTRHGVNVATNAEDSSVTAAFDVVPLAISLTEPEAVTVTYDRAAHTIGAPIVTVPTVNFTTNYWCADKSGQATEAEAAATQPEFTDVKCVGGAVLAYEIHYKVESPFYATTGGVQTLTIEQAQISDWKFYTPRPGEPATKTLVYNGSNQCVRATWVKAGDLTLDSTEYALSESNKVNVGTYTSVVRAASSNFTNATAELKGEWKIAPKPIGSCEVVVTFAHDIVHTGAELTITNGDITAVACAGLPMAADEYAFAWNPQTAVGTYKTKLTASGNFSGTKDIQWEIKAAPLALALGLGASPAPTPAAATPEITVSQVDVQSLAGGSTQITITWTPGVQAGYTYTLVGKKALDDLTWTPLASFTAAADSEAEADRRITVTTSEGYQFFTVEVK